MTGLHWPVSVPWKHSGDCTVRGPCISSPNYPSFYGNSQRCNISLPKPSVLRVVDFATEAEYDVLTVNGMRYSGVSGDSSSEPALAVGDVFVLWTDIVWESDYRDSNIGWELCVEPLPSCFDGLSLHPAPVADCPRDGEVSLMDCQTAEPGALCLGGKDCGTRGDINNCYDSLLTHPPTLDVYRKGNGTTRTTTGTTLTTQTSITHTSTTRTLTTQPAPAYLEELCCVQQKLWILDHTIGLQVSVCKSRCYNWVANSLRKQSRCGRCRGPVLSLQAACKARTSRTNIPIANPATYRCRGHIRSM